MTELGAANGEIRRSLASDELHRSGLGKSRAKRVPRDSTADPSTTGRPCEPAASGVRRITEPCCCGRRRLRAYEAARKFDRNYTKLPDRSYTMLEDNQDLSAG